MPPDQKRAWALRSTLVAVASLDQSVDFYRELGPFEELVREDAVRDTSGEASPGSIMLLLQAKRMEHTSDSPRPTVDRPALNDLQHRITR